MGRPSMAAQRTDELLDAVERVILRDGVAATTVASVAREADTHTSLVHHYLGSRQDALDAAVDRALQRVEGLITDALRDVPADNRLAAQLDVLFSPALDDPRIEQLVEHLIVASYADERLRERLGAMYRRFTEIIEEAVADARPQLPADRRRRLAHAVVALGHASPTLSWLRLDPDLTADLRAAAQRLVESAEA